MNSDNFSRLEKARCSINNGKAIAILWYSDDIKDRAKDRGIAISDSDARKILSTLERGHDAELGICWDTIDVTTDLHLRDSLVT